MTSATLRGRPKRALPADPGFSRRVPCRHSTAALWLCPVITQVEAFGHRIAKAQEAVADVAHEDAQAQGLGHGLALDARPYVSQIGVAEHRRHRRQPAEPIEDAGADIAGMDDPLRPREQVVEQGIVVAVRVADDADEGSCVHARKDTDAEGSGAAAALAAAKTGGRR